MVKALVLILSLFGVLSQDSLVQLPALEVLEKRISAITNDHFLETTHLAQRLARHQVTPMGVGIAVESALDDYYNYCGDATIAWKSRSPLIESILEEYPEAIQELRDQGVLRKE